MSQNFSEELDPKFLGERIRQLRTEKGLKQAAFVGDLISSGYISLIEQGKRLPSKKALKHITSVLGVSLDELLDPPAQTFSLQQEALVMQAEVLLAVGDFLAVQEVLKRFDENTALSLKGQLLHIEMEYGLGNYLAADMTVKDVIEASLALHDWPILRRAVIVYGRLADKLLTMLDATIYLSQIRRELKKIEHVDPLVKVQVSAQVADRLASLGDVASAQRMLDELDELLPLVSDRRGRGSALWAGANIAYDAGDFERATELARTARALFAEELDTMAVLILHLLYAGIVVECAPSDDPRLVTVESEISELYKQHYASVDVSVAREIKIIHADLLVRLGQDIKAESIYNAMLAEDEISVEYIAHLNVQLAGISVRRGDNQLAKQKLDEAWALIQQIESVPTARKRLLLVADLYEAIGDQAMVIAVLRSVNKPVGDLSAILRD